MVVCTILRLPVKDYYWEFTWGRIVDLPQMKGSSKHSFSNIAWHKSYAAGYVLFSAVISSSYTFGSVEVWLEPFTI